MPNLNNVPTLPSYLLERLSACYSQEQTDRICAGYAAQRAVSFRVNTLKATVPAVLEQLQTAGIATTPVAWSETAFFCTDSTTEAQLQALSCYENGEIYLQSLSSMLPPIVLQPQPKQEILDMTAAPGGKTTQMAAMTQNQANIMACELHTIRAEKLKYNVEKQGAKRVTVSITEPGRRSFCLCGRYSRVASSHGGRRQSLFCVEFAFLCQNKSYCSIVSALRESCFS